MESWDGNDCITQQLLEVVSQEDVYFEDDCIAQQIRAMKIQINGICKKKYDPLTYENDVDIQQFNVYQNITKRDYEESALTELQSYSKMFRSAKHSIEHHLESLDNSLELKEACDTRFQSAFHELKDNFLDKPTKCSLLNPVKNMSWEGECYLCSEYFCFAINNPEIEGFCTPLKMSIPYVNIVAITKAGRKYHHDRIHGKKPAKCVTNISPVVL